MQGEATASESRSVSFLNTFFLWLDVVALALVAGWVVYWAAISVEAMGFNKSLPYILWERAVFYLVVCSTLAVLAIRKESWIRSKKKRLAIDAVGVFVPVIVFVGHVLPAILAID